MCPACLMRQRPFVGLLDIVGFAAWLVQCNADGHVHDG